MEEEIQKNIEERVAELPEDIKEAILASDFEEKIRTIGGKNNLHVDQVGTLGDLAMLVMLGFAPHEAFESSIATGLNVSPEQARTLATDVNTQIFISIRESMKNFAKTKTPPVPPVAPKALAPHPADMMLSQKTVTTATAAPKPAVPPAPIAPKPPVAPKPYTTDPYREPTE